MVVEVLRERPESSHIPSEKEMREVYGGYDRNNVNGAP